VLTSAPKPGFYFKRFSENVTIYKVGLHKKDLHFWRKAEVIEWLVKARFQYRRLVRESHYNLVHAFFAFPSGWLCYRTVDRIPYLISLRGSDVPGYNIRLKLDYKLLTGLFRRIWSSASAIVANSEGLKDLALKFMPGLDIIVIPNGIDTEKFHPAEGRLDPVQPPEGGWNPVQGFALPEKKGLLKPLRALTVSRLIERKRIDLLIMAIACLKELGVGIKLNIAGDGNLLRKLQNLAKKLKIADNVIFLGMVPEEDMPQLYRDNDIFLLSSAHEGMSNAMLEAMASGLPIITTRCEGVDELIADNGIVVEGGRPADIAEAIKKMMIDPQIYGQMVIAARKRAEQFRWKAVAHQYRQLYMNILHEES
jgi:glycosyltransferase involved in cell wall biosynthesis